MKIFKLLLTPMKYLTYICVILALIYYRSIIFHSNVNHYIDIADAYLEQSFDIVIPSHVAEISEVVIDASEKDVEVVKEADVSNDVDNPVAVDVAEVVVTSEAVDAAKEGEKKAADEAEVTESPVTDAKAGEDVSIKDDGGSNIIKQLSETVNSLNKKIDVLFEKSNSSSVVESSANEKEPVVWMSKEVSQFDKNPSSIVNDGKTLDKDSNDLVNSNTRKMLLMARQTFWNGNARDSEKIYLDLVGMEDIDPDVYGELGNVYYSQGKWEQAGKAYYEAAIRLLELKKNDQVSYLLRVIQGLDASSAEKLRQKMSG